MNLKLDAFPPPVILPPTIFSLVTRNSIFNRIFFWGMKHLAYQNKLYGGGGFRSDHDVPKERQRQQTIINSAYRAPAVTEQTASEEIPNSWFLGGTGS